MFGISRTGQLLVLDLSKPQTQPWVQDLASGIHSVAFSTDGNQLVTGSEDGGLRLWTLHNTFESAEFNQRLPQVYFPDCPDLADLYFNLTLSTDRISYANCVQSNHN
jgi:WD40 repeat protein